MSTAEALAFEHGVRVGLTGNLPEFNPYEPVYSMKVGDPIDTAEVRDALPIGTVLKWTGTSRSREQLRYTVTEQHGVKYLTGSAANHSLETLTLGILEVESLP